MREHLQIFNEYNNFIIYSNEITEYRYGYLNTITYLIPGGRAINSKSSLPPSEATVPTKRLQICLTIIIKQNVL